MKLLQDNPVFEPDTEIDYSIQSFDNPMDEIKRLEDKYNQGNKFPKAFEELLFIAGEYCWARETPRDYDRCNDKHLVELAVKAGYNVGRPFFVFEDGEGDYVRFFYLDEDDDDPKLYDILYNYIDTVGYDIELLDSGFTLTGLIEHRVRWNLERLEKGWSY